MTRKQGFFGGCFRDEQDTQGLFGLLLRAHVALTTQRRENEAILCVLCAECSPFLHSPLIPCPAPPSFLT